MTVVQQFQTVLLIGLAGGVGSILRYLVGGWAQSITAGWSLTMGGVFPVGTLTVNVVGCFVIAALNVALVTPFPPIYRMAILVGLLGGFTTFSSFGFETLSLMNDGQWGLVIANVVLSNGLGLTAAWLGYHLAQRWFGVTG